MTTFCLVHGAWHDASCWERLSELLEARGHQAVAPTLPYDDPATGYEDRIRPVLDELDSVHDHLLIVGHSMGSAYATLVAVARPGSLLVQLCPRLGPFPSPEVAPDTFRPGFPFPPSKPDGTSAWDPGEAMRAMYPRLPPDTARGLARRLCPMAPAAGEYPLSSYPDIDTALIYASEDEFFEPAWERFMAREVLDIEPIEIAGGHFPMAEDPAALADLLDRLAAEHSARQ
jgi:pimeloyl-ACP methyl ester carboxylesterase